MIKKINIHRNEQGSFTLESSLVFPVIFVAILILLFFCLYLYQNALLAHSAAIAADRTSYVWDNSHKDPRTGAVEIGEHDSLYWRLTSDGLLRGIFNLGGGESTASVNLPASSSDGVQPAQKLSRVASQLPNGFNGEIRYDHKLLTRKVEVSLKRLIRFAPLETVIGDSTQAGEATSYIVDPVEFIRTVDLARYYGAKFKPANQNHINQIEAGNALQLFGK